METGTFSVYKKEKEEREGEIVTGRNHAITLHLCKLLCYVSRTELFNITSSDILRI